MNSRELQKYRLARLVEAIEVVSRGNVSHFSRRLGQKTSGFVSQMLRGERKVTENTIQAIEQLPGLSNWFSKENPVLEAKLEENPKISQYYASVNNLKTEGGKQFVDNFIRADFEDRLNPKLVSALIAVLNIADAPQQRQFARSDPTEEAKLAQQAKATLINDFSVTDQTHDERSERRAKKGSSGRRS